MAFNVADIVGPNTRLVQDSAEGPLLRLGVGSSDGLGLGRVARARPKHDGLDRVPIGEGIFKPLQDDRPHALAAAVAVRALVKCLAVPGP